MGKSQNTCRKGELPSVCPDTGKKTGKRHHLVDSLQAIPWKDQKAQGLNQRSDLFVSHSKVALGTSSADGISPALHSVGGLRPFIAPRPFWLTFSLLLLFLTQGMFVCGCERRVPPSALLS